VPRGLGTDGYLSGGTAGSRSDRCGSPTGPRVKRRPTRGPATLSQ